MSSDKKKAKKKIWKRLGFLLFVLLNVGVIAWTALSEFSKNEDASDLAEVQMKWWLLIPAVLMFVLALFSEVYKYYVLMKKTHSEPDGLSRRKLWRVAQRTVLLGRYYDNITPAAIGGQPFQIYYMHRSKVKNGYDAVIPLIGMITDQLGFIVIAVFALLIGSLTNEIWSPAIVAVGWIGLIFFAFFPLVIIGATFLPRATTAIIKTAIGLLSRLHIVKDRKASTKKALDNTKQYADGIKTILKESGGLFARTILLGAVYYAALTMIPFFVLSAFGAQIGVFACFATTIAVSAAVYFIPTPGNAGAAEGTFYSVFSVLPVSGYVFWAMLIWRLLVYYMWLALGGLTQLRIYFEDKSLLKTWNSGVKKIGKVAKTVVENAGEDEGEEE